MREKSTCNEHRPFPPGFRSSLTGTLRREIGPPGSVTTASTTMTFLKGQIRRNLILLSGPTVAASTGDTAPTNP